MPQPEAAVAIVRTREPDARVLFIRRAERDGDPWSGHWSFPGGHCDASDADLVRTALRELAEECGIRIGRENLEVALAPSVARRRTPPFVWVAPFVFAVDGPPPVVLDPREAVGAIWVPSSTLRDPALHRLQCVAGVPPNFLFPAIELNGWPLWGFTYRLISDWLDLAPRQADSTAAQAALDFLLSRGLALKSGWNESSAEVEGTIPVADVLAEFSKPGAHVPRINMLEVQPGMIRVLGLAFEEYRITSPAPPTSSRRRGSPRESS